MSTMRDLFVGESVSFNPNKDLKKVAVVLDIDASGLVALRVTELTLLPCAAWNARMPEYKVGDVILLDRPLLVLNKE